MQPDNPISTPTVADAHNAPLNRSFSKAFSRSMSHRSGLSFSQEEESTRSQVAPPKAFIKECNNETVVVGGRTIGATNVLTTLKPSEPAEVVDTSNPEIQPIAEVKEESISTEESIKWQGLWNNDYVLLGIMVFLGGSGAIKVTEGFKNGAPFLVTVAATLTATCLYLIYDLLNRIYAGKSTI